MKLLKIDDLNCLEYSVQELSSFETQHTAGGSLISFALGAVYGATLGALVSVTNWMYDNAFGSPYDKAATYA